MLSGYEYNLAIGRLFLGGRDQPVHDTAVAIANRHDASTLRHNDSGETSISAFKGSRAYDS